MSELRKTKVLLTAVYKDGKVLKQEHALPALVNVLPINGVTKFQELNIRLVVDTHDAEELLEGLIHGSTLLEVEQMLSPVEREVAV